MHHVDTERFLPGLRRIADRERADVADDGVDTAEFGGGAIDPALQRRGIGDIDTLAPGFDAFRRQAFYHLGNLVGVACTDRNVGALGREQFGDRKSDALAAARHQRILAF